MRRTIAFAALALASCSAAPTPRGLHYELRYDQEITAYGWDGFVLRAAQIWTDAIPELTIHASEGTCSRNDGPHLICVHLRTIEGLCHDTNAVADGCGLMGQTYEGDDGGDVYVSANAIFGNIFVNPFLTLGHEIGHATAGPSHLPGATLMNGNPTYWPASEAPTPADVARFWGARPPR